MEAADPANDGSAPVAAARREGRTRTPVVAFAGDEIFEAPFAGLMIGGAQLAAAEHDCLLLLTRISTDPDLGDWDVRALIDRGVAAGLVYAASGHRVALPVSTLARLPSVLVNDMPDNVDQSGVVGDHVGAGRDAVLILHAAGHRRIGYLHGDPLAPATRLRLAGYSSAIRAMGCVDVGRAMRTDISAVGGYRSTRELLARSHPPTALVCDDDRLALGVYQAARDLGVHVPTELSVIALSDTDLIADTLRPTLTTIRLPHDHMAWLAVHQLFDQLGTLHDRAACRTVVPFDVVERTSVASAPRPGTVG